MGVLPAYGFSVSLFFDRFVGFVASCLLGFLFSWFLGFLVSQFFGFLVSCPVSWFLDFCPGSCFLGIRGGDTKRINGADLHLWVLFPLVVSWFLGLFFRFLGHEREQKREWRLVVDLLFL